MRDWILPPHVYRETVYLSGGKKVDVYRAPLESEGPRLVAANGRETLCYMHAFFVFRWGRNMPTLEIGHGRLDRNMALWHAVPIRGPWSPETLIAFGRRWAHLELARFER
ncbi:hypothetical protein EV193_103411 [Herbihabitans rhizosphaerae]|uniref:Uncharacterized protein n=2 Tax=Herbihabitans rhizosphaerae TaxID=1872711 RepID=A0A4V2ETH5_9PSEU|nr:hypothetical protein EV193_103411 [Herbihabitans rhizosphaerae]